MKLAFVVPRYGLEVVGGAEYAARVLAEGLAATGGWEVEVLTTCALDSGSWADEYPPGTEEVNGVAVHRFRARSGRDPAFEDFSARVLARPEHATPEEQERWVDLQGPVAPDLVEATAGTDADLVAFSPYLYHPTVHGVRAVGARAVLHAATHDEAPIRLPLYRDVFGAAGSLVHYTHTERAVTEQLFPVAHKRQIVLGLPVEPGHGDPTIARRAVGLGDEPYLLCLGRVDDGKGAGMLAHFFTHLKRRRPGPLKLVFAGPVRQAPPAHPEVVVAGPVDETTKWGLLQGALALVSPSYYESFSFVVMEGWLAGVPVVVNAACSVTRDHAARSGGGLWFDGYGPFEAVVTRLAADAGLRRALAGRGRRYVEENYRAPVVIARYAAFLEAALAAVLGPVRRR